jgi:DNA-directed RNA polymerase subunit RPC12/RpoP
MINAQNRKFGKALLPTIISQLKCMCITVTQCSVPKNTMKNCNQSMWVQSSETRNAEPRDNNNSFLDSTMGTSNQDEISKVEMVNSSSKEFDQMVSLKSVAMETSTAGTNETIFSQNHEASASKKTLRCPNEVHICHRCGKRFQSIDSLYGHMRCHRQDEYKLICTIINQSLGTNTSMIHMPEVKQIWNASQALINGPMLSEQHPMHSTKAICVTGSSKDISRDTVQMMEVADLLIKLSQTGENVVKVPSSPSVRVFMCRTCNKIFDSYHALRRPLVHS